MRITRIYFANSLSVDSMVALDTAAVRHLSAVLRVKVGDEIILFNGDSFDYLAIIEQISKKSIHVKIRKKTINHATATLKINLAQSICRGEKMDWVIQKATELGISEITPIISEYGNVKLDQERWEKRILHWQKVTHSACEQSGRADLVIVHPPCTLNAFVRQQLSGEKIILSPTAAAPIAGKFSSNQLHLLIGPEGGFSSIEVNWAIECGFVAANLGRRILRTETAALASLSIVQYLWGEQENS